MDRRTFLKSIGVATGALSTAGLLAACGSGGGIPSGEAGLALLQPSYELLTGQARPYVFRLMTLENTAIEAEGVQVYLRDPEGEVLSGPHDAPSVSEETEISGMYRAELDLPQAGTMFVVAVHDGAYGQGAVSVAEPDGSRLPAPGQAAVAAPTATTSDDMGIAQVCTADPDCGMHESSLDEALADGRPIVLLFATPAYCQTAVCGPGVGTVDAARQRIGRDDIAWIHAEIYADEAATTTQAVQAWNLPSEPWLFTIGADGMITDRIDGPLVPGDVVAMAEAV